MDAWQILVIILIVIGWVVLVTAVNYLAQWYPRFLKQLSQDPVKAIVNLPDTQSEKPLPETPVEPANPAVPQPAKTVAWTMMPALLPWHRQLLPGLPTRFQAWLRLLACSMRAGALLALVGAGLIVYATLAVPVGSDSFWGLLGSGLGTVLGGAALLRATWDGYRQLEAGRDRQPPPTRTWQDRVLAVLLLLGPASLLTYAYLSDLGWKQLPVGRATIWGITHAGMSLAFLALMILEGRGTGVSNWWERLSEQVARRKKERQARAGLLASGLPRADGSEPKPRPQIGADDLENAPQGLLLMLGGLIGVAYILSGIRLTWTAVVQFPFWTGDFWFGIGAGLAFLWTGVASLYGTRDELRTWKGRRDVLEGSRWNWYDTLVVAWSAQVLALGTGVKLEGALPWTVAASLSTLAGIFFLQGMIYPMPRLVARTRARLAAESAAVPDRGGM